MTARAARRGLAATLVVGCALLGACTTKQADATGVPTERGGTLHVLLDSRVEAWDPQRIGTQTESAFAVRTFLRTLTAQAPAGTGFLPGLVGDLSTTTGVTQDGGRTWIFSLVSDAPWQDGRFVSCADVKYGVSRSFATDRITGGSQYALELLDIPSTTDAQGRTVSAYRGPYSRIGQDLYDKAVTCDGQEITFHLNTPRFDFDEIVSLPAFAPVRQDQDTDRTNRDPLSVFASGAYMLEGVWKPGEGGRFVRNRKWIARDDPVRNAWPDVIEVEEGLPTTTVAQRLLDSQGDDAMAITPSDAPTVMDAPAPGARRRRTGRAAGQRCRRRPAARRHDPGHEQPRGAAGLRGRHRPAGVCDGRRSADDALHLGPRAGHPRPARRRSARHLADGRPRRGSSRARRCRGDDAGAAPPRVCAVRGRDPGPDRAPTGLGAGRLRGDPGAANDRAGGRRRRARPSGPPPTRAVAPSSRSWSTGSATRPCRRRPPRPRPPPTRRAGTGRGAISTRP